MKRTPLNRGTKGLQRHTPLRSSGRPRGAFVPKSPSKATRPKVTPEERNARKTVKARSGGLCELHGDHPATDMHHRLNRSQGGLWAPENLLHLCRTAHHHVTVNPKAAAEQGWTVRRGRNPADVPTWLAGRGYCFLTPDGDVQETEEAA